MKYPDPPEKYERYRKIYAQAKANAKIMRLPT
jgi:hypothetical protein